MARFSTMARNIQAAINSQPGPKVVINTSQWYSDNHRRPLTLYTIRESEEGNNRKVNTLFKTYSHVQMVLFLRDYWYRKNGWEVPTDNPVWEDLKKQYEQKGVSSWNAVREVDA